MTAFLDSNIFIYALGSDEKGKIARELIATGGRISVQCLNEFASVALGRKLRRSLDDVEAALDEMRNSFAPVLPIDPAIHFNGMRVLRRYRLSVYDSMIVAAALACDCNILYSEDMHAGLLIDGKLRIVNPFV